MSKEDGSLQSLSSKKDKKLRSKHWEKSGKKRKRQESGDIESTFLIKKHRSKQHREATFESKAPPKKPELPPVSPCHQQTSSLYLPLPPISQKHPLKGLCAEHLSPLILTYYPPLHGVILSYSNARLSTGPSPNGDTAYAKAVDEYAACFVWVMADFLVFKVQKGDVIEGWVNLQNESNIGLLCLNFFNATIERRRLAKGWKWIAGGVKASSKRKLKKSAESADTDLEINEEGEQDDSGDSQGYFEDERGKRLEGLIRFRVRNVETSKSMDRESSFMNIEGTMLSEDEEKGLQKEEVSRMKEKSKGQSRHMMPGALRNNHDGAMDIDQPIELTPGPKHRAKY